MLPLPEPGKRLQKYIIAILLLAALPALLLADKSSDANTPSVKRVDSPTTDASVFALGWHYRIDLKRQGKPVSVDLTVPTSSLEGMDLNTLKLARYDEKEKRYEIVSNADLDTEGRLKVRVDQSGVYSLIGLPSLPTPVRAIAKLCSVSEGPGARLTKPLLDEVCPLIDCAAFKGYGLPNPFGGGAVCDRCYGLNGRAPGEIAECGLLFDMAREANSVPSCAALQTVARISDPSESGPYGTRSVSYTCDDQLSPSGTATLPLGLGGSVLPFVLYAHGEVDENLPAYKGYDYVLESLASHGFIAISIQSGIGPFANSENRAERIKYHLDCWRDGRVRLLEGETFSGRMDVNKIGLAGHSQGGEAILFAVTRNHNEGWGYGIGAIHAIAPADSYGRSIDDVPYLLLVGSADPNVYTEALRPYDRSHSTKPKIQVFVYGFGHDQFNSALMPPALDHQRVERTLAVSFFRHFLQEFQPARDLWTGKAQTASLNGVRLFFSYQEPEPLLVDSFESAESDRDPFRNDLGGQNESVPGRRPPDPATGQRRSPLAPLEEVFLDRHGVEVPALDRTFYHATHGLKVGWDFPWGAHPEDLHQVIEAPRFELQVPPKYRANAASKSFLAFRVAQYFDRNSNAGGQAQDFEVGLEDTDGKRRYVKVSNFAEIPWPYERNDGYTKSVLQTVRIPLCTFSDSRIAKNNVNTDSIAKILFRFNQKAGGLLAFDDVQFTE